MPSLRLPYHSFSSISIYAGLLAGEIFEDRQALFADEKRKAQLKELDLGISPIKGYVGLLTKIEGQEISIGLII